jgi:hypothetical protein
MVDLPATLSAYAKPEGGKVYTVVIDVLPLFDGLSDGRKTILRYAGLENSLRISESFLTHDQEEKGEILYSARCSAAMRPATHSARIQLSADKELGHGYVKKIVADSFEFIKVTWQSASKALRDEVSKEMFEADLHLEWKN